MRLRRAVLQISAKSSVPPRLPVYKSRPTLTPSESTLLQLLIPLHFISFISNTYKKPGGGCLLPSPKFYNSLLPEPHSASLSLYIVTSLRLYVINVDAASSISPLSATLTKNTGGWGIPSFSANSVHPGGGPTVSSPTRRSILSLTDRRTGTFDSSIAGRLDTPSPSPPCFFAKRKLEGIG
jgi:hypothetical protein